MSQSKPTFEAVRRDLVCRLYALAFTLNMSIRGDSGTVMLGLSPELMESEWPGYDDFDLSPFGDMESTLREVHRYAVFAEQENRFDTDEETGDLGHILALFGLTETTTVQRNLEDITWPHDKPDQPRGGLAEVLALAEARMELDDGRNLSIEQVALLAGIDDRTMRNAMYVQGEGHIGATKESYGGYTVTAVEARRWLCRRSDFSETVWVGKSAKTAIPSQLAADEIVPFIAHRLSVFYEDSYDFSEVRRRIFQQEELTDDLYTVIPGSGFVAAGRQVEWSGERVQALVSGGLENIHPEDCPAIARMLSIDSRWFTEQVMRAKFPEAMQSLAPVAVAVPLAPSSSPLSEAADTLDVVLTEAGINNGYIDIEMRYATRLFPGDSFGGRAADDRGQTVDLVFDGRTVASDIRIKSKAFASPRKRFNGWFRSQQAAPGDKVRFKRTAERRYELSFIAQSK